MLRFTPYLGVAAGILFGSFIIAFFGHVTPTTVVIPSASSSLAVSDIVSLQTTSVLEKSTPSKVVPTTTPSVPPSSERSAALRTSASALVDALVNIICYVPAGSGLHSISASGVFVDPKGIILTNAHVAQYFLLADRDVSCTIRSGVPATDRYKAKLIYISPTWLKKNPSVLMETLPNGTGEYDFAFLAVSESVTASPLSASFPFVQLAKVPPTSDMPVVIASYGAQFLDPDQIVSTLFPTMVFGSVKDIFTFDTNTVDVLSLGGSAIAQEGSSGGGVVDDNGELVGIVTTSTVSGAISTRSLIAITASYIRSEYAIETVHSLDLLLNKQTTTSIADFAPQIPALEAVITAQLP